MPEISWISRTRTILFAPVNIIPLIAFRVIFGGIMLWEVWRYFNYTRIYRYWIDPDFYFTYYGFGWVRPLPGDGMYWLWIGIAVLSLLIGVGLFYRVSSILFFFVFTYTFLLDQTQYLNHFYLIVLIAFIMMFLPLGRAWSVEAWLRPKLRQATIPGWQFYWLRIQLSIPYVYGGIAKLNADWLRGEPMRDWVLRRAEVPVIGPYLLTDFSPYFFSYGGLFFDLLVVPFILWRRTRWLAFAAAVFFHLMNAWLFPIGIFPWFMIGALLLYLPPEWFPKAHPDAPPRPTVSTRQRAFILTGIGAYLAWQLLFPFRHWLYPGDVAWTEEGHRFSWRMRLRDKDGAARFFVTDVQNNQVWEADPYQHLNPRQYNKMSGNPDMILQFVHHLERELQAKGFEDVEIRVWAPTVLNSRVPQVMIDSSMDLTEVRRSLAPMNYVVPLHQPLKASEQPLLTLRRSETELLVMNYSEAYIPLEFLKITDEDGNELPIQSQQTLSPDLCVIVFEELSSPYGEQCGTAGFLPFRGELPEGELQVWYGNVLLKTCNEPRCVVPFSG